MRALLDVNVLVALFDEAHAFNERAHLWLESNKENGWASCPLTENGLTRILSNRNYSLKIQRSVDWILESLSGFCRATNHEFWPDEVSLRDSRIFATDRIHSSRQITDLYLLALAAHRGGRLVTFDQAIPLSVVKPATPANLSVIS